MTGTGCQKSTCSGHGECLELKGNDVRCICDDGYTSDNCSIGKCRTFFYCFCKILLECKLLERLSFLWCNTYINNIFIINFKLPDIDDCSENPCIHGACSDLVNNFTCNCEPGYYGKTCQDSKYLLLVFKILINWDNKWTHWHLHF